MMSTKVNEILSKGKSLSSIGVENWALTKSASLNALSMFLELEIPVLGGDVCEINDGEISYNYDNWYCEREIGESAVDFILRSNQKAREYIEAYSVKDDSVLFAFVLG